MRLDTPGPMIRSICLRSLGPLLVLAAAACGDDPVRAAGAVEGLWRVQGEGADVVMRIDEGEVEMFVQDTIGDCYERTVYEILDVDGVRFRVTNQVDTFTVELRRDEDVLRVAAFGAEDTFGPTSLNTATLPLCQRPQPSARCGELAPIAVGQDVEGTLAATDGENDDGSRFDLYRLEVDAPLDVEIDMASEEVDSRLILYDSAAAFLQENDDASNLTLDAELTASLEAGCHILMATSAAPAELGTYTLTVDTP